MFNFVSQHALYKKLKPLIKTVAAGLFFFSLYTYALPQISTFINSKQKYETAKQASQIQWHHVKEPAFTQAIKEEKPMIIEFFADWCLPCRQMEINTFSDKQVQSTINQNYVALKVDASKSTKFSNEMMHKYRISAFPSIILFDQKQDKQKRLTGYIDAYQLKNALELFLND